MLKHFVCSRSDGTIEYIIDTDTETIPQGHLEVTDSESIVIHKDIDEYIVEAGKVRKRTEAELRARIREIYGAVRSGDLHRCKNDCIARYSRFFTPEELEEVETPEDTIKKLKQEVKKLKEAR